MKIQRNFWIEEEDWAAFKKICIDKRRPASDVIKRFILICIGSDKLEKDKAKIDKLEKEITERKELDERILNASKLV